jgi:hypothetical protein
VSKHFGSRLTLLILGLVLGVVAPAAADVTVLMRYTLIGGDTLIRATYYTSRRVRVTAPDGREFMFDRRGDSVTVINHAARTYWTGPRAVADTIAQKIIEMNREGVAELAADPEAWSKMVEAFNDSIHVAQTHKQRKIAGIPCDEWVLTAGHYMTSRRWIARSLDVPDYGPELQKVVMAAIRDPLGRQLMRLLIASRTKDGLALAGRTTFRTLGKAGNFDFEAINVKSGEVPAKAWDIPTNYLPINF